MCIAIPVSRAWIFGCHGIDTGNDVRIQWIDCWDWFQLDLDCHCCAHRWLRSFLPSFLHSFASPVPGTIAIWMNSCCWWWIGVTFPLAAFSVPPKAELYMISTPFVWFHVRIIQTISTTLHNQKQFWKNRIHTNHTNHTIHTLSHPFITNNTKHAS